MSRLHFIVPSNKEAAILVSVREISTFPRELVPSTSFDPRRSFKGCFQAWLSALDAGGTNAVALKRVRSMDQQMELPPERPPPQAHFGAGIPKGNAPNQARRTVSGWTLPRPFLSCIISQKVSKMGTRS